MRTLMVITACILLAAATRLYYIDYQSLWFDEGWSAFAAVQPSLQAAIEADPTNPPLYYVLLNLTTRGFGDSPLGLRVTSLLLGLLAIPLAYQLARRLFGVRAGVLTAALMALSPPLWWASQEARMYTLLALLVLLMAIAWHQLRLKPLRWAWIMLLLAELGLLYAHNTGPAVVLWINGVMLIDWLVRRRFSRPGILRWFGGQLAVGVLWLPWLLTRFLDVQAANSALVRRPQITPEFLGQLWQAFWVAPWAMIGEESSLLVYTVVLFVLALVLIPWRNVNACWLVLHAVLLVAGLLAGLSLIGNEMHGRYVVMIVPLLLVAVGAGLASLRLAVLRYVGLGMFAGLFVVNVVLAQNPAYQHDDVRGMAHYYAEMLTAGDTVLAWSYADRFDLAYYWRHLEIPARRITLPEGADLHEIAPLLPESGDVALNVWYTQRADFRGMMGCVLGNGTTQLPVQHTVYGMTNALYRAPSLRMPELRPLEQPLLHDGIPLATVTAAGELVPMAADQALCVPVELRLQQAVDVDLQAALIVRNGFGWDVAQTSAIFATANQRTSAQLAPGETLTAYALLRLPYGAPPDDYDIFLRLFDETRQPSGYDFTAQANPGKDFLLGTWQVEPGADWEATYRQTPLPNRVDLRVGQSLALLAHDLNPATLSPGADLRLQLLWQGDDRLPDLTFAPQNESHATVVTADPGPRDSITLDWRVLRVPLEADPGVAHLRLPDGTVLAEYTIDSLPFVSEPPGFDVEVGEAVPGIGTLAGYSAGAAVIDQRLPITLVWQVGDSEIDTSYTVFVQLLDANGRLIAQSDSLPAQGERPTTGWRAGEYIVDAHRLQFNDLAAPGEATLIAGLYDARTGERVPVNTDGADYITLPGVITVR